MVQSFKALPLWWKPGANTPKQTRQGSPAPVEGRRRGRPPKQGLLPVAGEPTPAVNQDGLRKAAMEADGQGNTSANKQPGISFGQMCEKPPANSGANLRKVAEEAACDNAPMRKAGWENKQCEKGPEISQSAAQCPQQSPAQARLAALRARVLARIGNGGSG